MDEISRRMAAIEASHRYGEEWTGHILRACRQARTGEEQRPPDTRWAILADMARESLGGELPPADDMAAALAHFGHMSHGDAAWLARAAHATRAAYVGARQVEIPRR